MNRVVAFGTFDILHPGHVKYLSRASSYGDELIVGLTPSSKKLGKSPDTVIEDRKFSVSSLEFVDEVIELEKNIDDIVQQVDSLEVDVIVFGYDHGKYIDYFNHLDCEIKKAEKYKSYSTSDFK